jgi:hypothetical protein
MSRVTSDGEHHRTLSLNVPVEVVADLRTAAARVDASPSFVVHRLVREHLLSDGIKPLSREPIKRKRGGGKGSPKSGNGK